MDYPHVGTWLRKLCVMLSELKALLKPGRFSTRPPHTPTLFETPRLQRSDRASRSRHVDSNSTWRASNDAGLLLRDLLGITGLESPLIVLLNRSLKSNSHKPQEYKAQQFRPTLSYFMAGSKAAVPVKLTCPKQAVTLCQSSATLRQVQAERPVWDPRKSAGIPRRPRLLNGLQFCRGWRGSQ